MKLFLEDPEHVHDLVHLGLNASLSIYLANFLPILIVEIPVQGDTKHCNV